MKNNNYFFFSKYIFTCLTLWLGFIFNDFSLAFKERWKRQFSSPVFYTQITGIKTFFISDLPICLMMQ